MTVGGDRGVKRNHDKVSAFHVYCVPSYQDDKIRTGFSLFLKNIDSRALHLERRKVLPFY